MLRRTLFALMAAALPVIADDRRQIHSGGADDVDTPICAIQGSEPAPSFVGQRLTITGVVTADFTATSLAGFFVQDPQCDGDPATSDGIWVDAGAARPPLVEGHRVNVAGRVGDEGGLSRLALESATDLGPYPGSIGAVRLSVPTDPLAAAAYLEAHEGMLVQLPPSRVVAATNSVGEAYMLPVSAGVTRLFRGDADGRRVGVSAPGRWVALDHGDLLPDAAGPLSFLSGQYQVLLRVDATASVTRAAAPLPAAPAVSPGGLSIATYNLDSLFDVADDPARDDVRVTPDQYAAALSRRASSIAVRLALPDVIAVQEVETLGVLQDLAGQPAMLPAGYQAALVEGPDGRGLDVGLLIRATRLFLRAAEARQGCTDIRVSDGPVGSCTTPTGAVGGPLFSRPPLVAHLETRDGSARFNVVVAAFQAQDGSGTADDSLRLAQADFVLGLVGELKAAEPSAPVIVAGDLGDFEDSPTLQRLTADGRLVDLHRRPGSERPYTHNSQGHSQVLDYVLVDQSIAARVREFRTLHVNVDYADPGPNPPTATARASDHDPVVVVVQ